MYYLRASHPIQHDLISTLPEELLVSLDQRTLLKLCDCMSFLTVQKCWTEQLHVGRPCWWQTVEGTAKKQDEEPNHHPRVSISIVTRCSTLGVGDFVTLEIWHCSISEFPVAKPSKPIYPWTTIRAILHHPSYLYTHRMQTVSMFTSRINSFNFNHENSSHSMHRIVSPDEVDE